MKTILALLFFITIASLNISCSENSDMPDLGDDISLPPTEGPIFSVTTVDLSDDLTIDIYVPNIKHPSGSYPIIYFNDGDVYKGAVTSLTTYKLGTADGIEPFIMVGIHSAGQRYGRFIPYHDEWIKENRVAYTPGSRNYTERIINEIMPLVEQDYPVDIKRRAIFGFSLSGLHATWATLNYPDVFSFAASLSPSFWIADYAIFDEPKEASDSRFYFDIGTKEWNYYVPFIASLEEKGFEYGKDIFYYEVPNGIHAESDWANRLHIPLRLFLEGVPSEVEKYEVITECIPSQSIVGLTFQRLNPIVTFKNGVRHSLSTSASYQVIGGDGEVLEDGRFDVLGGSMVVEVSFADWSEHVTLSDCN